MEIDSTTVARLRLVYPDIRVRWIRVANYMWDHHQIQIGIAEGLRTFQHQKDLFDQGRTKPGKIVTYAKPGDSFHHYGCAIDSRFIGNNPWLDHDPRQKFLWEEYARFGELVGFTAGARWLGKKQDRPHLELSYGLSLAQVKDLYRFNENASVWARFDQLRGVPIKTEWGNPLSTTRQLALGQLPPTDLHFA